MRDKLNLFDYDRASMEKLFVSLDEPTFRARQVLQWMYRRNVIKINEMTDLSLQLRNRLYDLV